MMAILGFEFIMQLVGITLFCHRITLLQIIAHMLGCLFTIWFSLDSWRYTYFWYLWTFFGAVPFLLEVMGLVSACCWNRDIYRNLREIRG